MAQLTQPKGMVSKETNKEAIARVFGLKKRQVGYLSTSTAVDSYTILYDEDTQTCWYRGSATGTPSSWSISGSILTLYTSMGIFSLEKGLSISDLSTNIGASKIGLSQGGYVQDSVTWRSVLSFGAKGDGVNDDTSAFQLAWEASDEYILIPSGYTFRINGQVGSLVVGKSKKWMGQPGSKIVLGVSGGFQVSGLNWGFDSIRFIPSAPNVGFAIKSGTVNSNRNSFITNCEFRGTTSGTYFAVAVDLYNVWYSTFRSNYINNSGENDFSKQVFAGVGLRFNYSVNNTITDNKIGSCEIGLHITSVPSPVGLLSSQFACEGLMISKNTLIANLCNLKVQEGYFIDVYDNVIDIPLTSTINPVYFAAMCSRLANNWIACSVGEIYIGKGEAGLTYDGSGNTVDGNVIRASSGSTNNLIHVGPSVGLLAITNNQMFFGGYAIKSDGGSNWNVSNNTFSAQSVMAYDLHLTSLLLLDKNKVYSPSIPSKSAADNAVITPTSHFKIENVSLIAAALTSGNVVTTAQTFTVSVPSGHFLSAPDIAMATLATGSTLGVCRYVRGESSATTLSFSYVGIGSPVAAGTYAFSILAMDRNSSF